jgi:hypothetical protein
MSQSAAQRTRRGKHVVAVVKFVELTEKKALHREGNRLFFWSFSQRISWHIAKAWRKSGEKNKGRTIPASLVKHQIEE